MHTLVTGGAGFIGSTLVDRLLAEGHSVVVIDNLASGKLTNLEQAQQQHGDRLTFHHLDICEAKAEDVVAEAMPEVVFHLAAQVDVRVSVAQPVFDAMVNAIGSLNVLEGARQAGSRKFVFASSGGTIYGEVADADLPVNEQQLQRPLSPYGITKRVVSDYLASYNSLYGMQYASLALANVFGPRQDPHGEAGVVAIFGARLLEDRQCTIYGDGAATRDYVYVDDVVDAFVRASTAGHGLYNIGTGVETTTTQLYQAMAAAAGVATAALYAPARAGELARSALDATRARTELGWEPKVNVATGSANVLDYIRRQGLVT